ncbi:dipeptidyl peptidase 2 isoform X2 [Hypanus sabinus]|uniref:dipeptidyl peptidase 2 isoform X2 n=1 Tax=Hypanus sabinus TaxID=79690 RepID=UPI0028C46D72|nr:dipeptidyl peptidase 2 isoform X2 [Hypanus sabinus]
MKCGRPLGLLLLFGLGAPSAQLFIPPGGAKPAPSPESVVTIAVTASEVGMGSPSSATPATTWAAVTVTDAPTTQQLQIVIDMDRVAVQAGGTAEPMRRIIEVSGGADANRSAVTGLPPPAREVEEVLVRLTPATEETLGTSTASSTTFSPSVLVEEQVPSSTPTAAPKGDQPEPTGVLGQAWQQQLEKGPLHDDGASPTKRVKQWHDTEEEAEPEKPKRANSSRKSKPNGPDKKKTLLIAEEGEGTLPPLSITKTSQVYLLIKEVDVNPKEFQRETEIPVKIQILTADTATSTETIITQSTDTTVASIDSEGDETVIDINDKSIRIEEKVEKTITSNPKFKEMYVEQLVDHFSFNAHRKTFRQRYLITDQFWSKSIGPIFLYTGNEGDIWDFAKNCGFISELAAEQQALVIFAEHRYYGKSLPFGKKSYERINIEFLTVEQAIADYILLITKLKSELDAENCPVIAFGGSYGGMLSAYIRIKYPNIVEGALASSAPVVSAANIGDSRQFFHDVTIDFERVSPDCVSKIREAFKELEKYIQQQAWNKIGNELSLCKPLKSKKEADHLYGWARNAFTYLAMFNYPYETEMGLHFPANPVDVACHYIIQKSELIGGLLSILNMFYNSTGTKKCFDIYTEYQHCADPTGCGLGSASQAWDFQVCTEVNLLYETNNETDMFPVLPFTEGMRRSYCHSKWGVYPNTEWLKIQYWGEDFKAASNIIFSNGELDPWANGGILRNMTPSVVAYIIEGGAHHLDLRASNPADPQSVTIIRKRESSIISEWVKKYQRHSV